MPKMRRDSKTIPIPKRGSRAAEGFFASWREINRFFNFVLHLVGHVDSAAETAHKALVSVEQDETRKAEMVKAWEKRAKAADELRKNRQFFLEVILVRHVENFLNYLAALLYEIFTQRPETLRSSETVEVASVLRHESIESLVRDIAERKVDSLSYSSFQELAKFFDDRFGLTLADGSDLSLLLEAIEIRNISVHNRCVMNRRFVSRLELSADKIGKKHELFIEYLDELVPMLAGRTVAVDRQAAAKLSLRGVRFAKAVAKKPS